MFNQILYYLVVKEDAENQGDTQGRGSGYASGEFLPDEEIQKVIFDKQYIKFLKKNQKEQAKTGWEEIQSNALISAKSKMSKLQVVQYECIKSELKEEYDKKVFSLKNRL